MFKPLPPTNVERTIIRQLFPGSLEYINAKFLDAARRGDVETLKTCLGHCIDINTVNVNYLTALHHATSEAVHEGHYEVVKLLLQRGANFNMRGGLGIDVYTAEEGLHRYPPSAQRYQNKNFKFT
ncbi:MAG: Ankyrin repeat (3 copies) [Gammaproteobacteria bacterium]|jgi:ankyrin repeat protein|nr:Ankyrin repeat (3 copies) [Gammaproteobacteria bacterium]